MATRTPTDLPVSSDTVQDAKVDENEFREHQEGLELLSEGFDQLAEKLDRREKELDQRAKDLDRRAEKLRKDETLLQEFFHSFHISFVHVFDYWTAYTYLLGADLLTALVLYVFGLHRLFQLSVPVVALVLYMPLAYVAWNKRFHRVLKGTSPRNFEIFVAVLLMQILVSTISIMNTANTVFSGTRKVQNATVQATMRSFVVLLAISHGALAFAHFGILRSRYSLYREGSAGPSKARLTTDQGIGSDGENDSE